MAGLPSIKGKVVPQLLSALARPLSSLAYKAVPSLNALSLPVAFSLLPTTAAAALALRDVRSEGMKTKAAMSFEDAPTPPAAAAVSGILVGGFVNNKSHEKSKSEDAHVLDTATRVLAVFDGVGGWAREKVDPALFPTKLAEGVNIAIRNREELLRLRLNPAPHLLRIAELEKEIGVWNPQSVMDFSHRYARKHVAMGSSTACIALVESTDSAPSAAVLSAANLGDSGWLVYSPSDNMISRKSKEQQHYFNCPFQLGANNVQGDTSQSASVEQISLQLGDVIVLCTDGLLDNVHHSEIADVIRSKYAPVMTKTELTEIANDLYAKAESQFEQLGGKTPYGERYIEHLKKTAPMMVEKAKKSIGGKRDDVCVVIAQYRAPTEEERRNSAT